MTTTPQTLTTEECEKLLHQLRDIYGTTKQRHKAVRNRCMALLMLDAGLRVGEVVQLSIDDLYFHNEPRYHLRIMATVAKNNKERIIPLSKRIHDAIEAMHIHYWSAADKYVNYYAFGAMNANTHVTTRQVERIVRKAAMKSLGRPVHPHVLRHTFASRLMRTTNARVVQELLGHSHLTTTQIYTHPNQEDLKTAIQSLDRNQSNNEVTESRSISTPEIANGTDTMNANRDMR